MAWIADIISVGNNQTTAKVVVRYSNGAATKEITYDVVDLANLKNLATEQVAALNATESFLASPPSGTIDTTKPIIPPTQDALDRAKFAKDYIVYKKMLSLIASGIKQADDEDFITLGDSIKQRLLAHPEYIDLVQ